MPVAKTVKTLMVHATEESGHKLVALLVRGDHELNEVKAEKLQHVASPLTFATEAEIREHMSPNLCRCGTHMRILRAVGRAAAQMRAARPKP